MKLRSGKTLNCFQSTVFYRETTLFGSMNTIMDEIERECYDVNVDYDHWSLVFYDHPNEFQFYQKYSTGLKLGLLCARQVVFAGYVQRWRLVINQVRNLQLKEVIVSKLEQVVQNLEERPGWSDFPWCGCADYERRRAEERQMLYFNAVGPGFLYDGVWVPTPSVSRDAFLEHAQQKASLWRHDLGPLLRQYEQLLAYFIRVPHQIYQDVYFRLASVLPRECANHILSFL